MKAVDLLYRSL